MLPKNFLKISALSAFLLVLASHPAAAKADGAFALHGADKDYSVSAATLAEWQKPSGSGASYISLQPENNLNDFVLEELGLREETNKRINFNKYGVGSIYKYLKSIQPDIDRDAQNAAMVLSDGRVTEFNPGANGQSLDILSSIDSIVSALDQNQTGADLNISQTEPGNTLAQTNNLGIKELVAYGESNFRGSPSNRIFNIKVGVAKESGIIIKPGEEFSFNKNLGPVDGEHGFLPELVIKKTGTVPEFGGGLCQVSSTVFRSAMRAGLPITARRNHSYAVSYYAPQGTDATIYPGVQDLKFINDTGNNLLLWPTIEGTILRFYLYGSKDGRNVVLDDPKTFDRKPDGSMKATWTRTVTLADGEVKKDTFNSNYQSPALFHKTETFPANVNPSPTAPLNQSVPATTNPSQQ